MPTIWRVGGFRFFFHSREQNEPPHVHVEKAENEAKFWLSPVTLAWNEGFRSDELTRIREMVERNASSLLRRWNEHFGQ